MAAIEWYSEFWNTTFAPLGYAVQLANAATPAHRPPLPEVAVAVAVRVAVAVGVRVGVGPPPVGVTVRVAVEVGVRVAVGVGEPPPNSEYSRRFGEPAPGLPTT